MENKDFQNNVRKLIYEEFQNRLGEQVQLYDETRDILFTKLKELSTKKFVTEENYLESCRIMDNIAITLLETE
ncbi:MAG: hypothetical protein LIO71_07710 [Ruminococcus sp.]|nr:hypothetical protein [Ruminococcus sp.]